MPLTSEPRQQFRSSGLSCTTSVTQWMSYAYSQFTPFHILPRTMHKKLSLAYRVLSIPLISRAISQYLTTEDCWNCQQIFPTWTYLTSTPIVLGSHTSESEVISLLVNKCLKTRLTTNNYTCNGGALRFLKNVATTQGPLNITYLDLSHQSIEIKEYLMLFQRDPTSKYECLLPRLKYFKTTVHMLENRLDMNDHFQMIDCVMPKNLVELDVLIIRIQNDPFLMQFLKTLGHVQRLTLREAFYSMRSWYRFIVINSFYSVKFPNITHIQLSPHSCLFQFLYDSRLCKESGNFPKLRGLTIEILHLATVDFFPDIYYRIFKNIDLTFAVHSEAFFHRLDKCESCESFSFQNKVTDKYLNWSSIIDHNKNLSNVWQSIIFRGSSRTFYKHNGFFPQILTSLYIHLNFQHIKELYQTDESVIEKILSEKLVTVKNITICTCLDCFNINKNEILKLFSRFCTRKFLNILRLCKNSLLSLEVSSELCYGCCYIEEIRDHLNTIKASCTDMKYLTISRENTIVQSCMQFNSIAFNDFEPFLSLFPNLTELRICLRYLIKTPRLSCILLACPTLQKLYLSTEHISDENLQNMVDMTPQKHDIQTMLMDFSSLAVPFNLTNLISYQKARYIMFRTGYRGFPTSSEINSIFGQMPNLQWLVFTVRRLSNTLVCHREPGHREPIVRLLLLHDTLTLNAEYPELFSIFWWELFKWDARKLHIK